MVGTAHVQTDTSLFEEGLPKFTGENLVAIRHNSRRQPMKFVDLMEESLSNRHCSEGVSKGHKVCVFSKEISTTKMQLKLPDRGRPSMKSMEIVFQADLGTSKGCSRPGARDLSDLAC